MTNSEMEEIIPSLRQLVESITTGNVASYEEKINKTADKALDMLSTMITDGTLALDPEQAVKAVQVLTKAKSDIFESKRKLAETIIKGQAMMMAIEEDKKKKGNGNSALLDYLEKSGLNTTLDQTGTEPGSVASIFQSIAAESENE